VSPRFKLKMRTRSFYTRARSYDTYHIKTHVIFILGGDKSHERDDGRKGDMLSHSVQALHNQGVAKKKSAQSMLRDAIGPGGLMLRPRPRVDSS
jgi:hypothetical protein